MNGCCSFLSLNGIQLFFPNFLRRTSEAQKPVDPQIHYDPDSDDDFDYEDPDEDLYI